MLKEIAVEGVLRHKAKSRERGAGWQVVADKITPNFTNIDVTSGAVRERFKYLERKHRLKISAEERASGISVEELTEGENLLEELTEIDQETEKRVEKVMLESQLLKGKDVRHWKCGKEPWSVLGKPRSVKKMKRKMEKGKEEDQVKLLSG